MNLDQEQEPFPRSAARGRRADLCALAATRAPLGSRNAFPQPRVRVG
jgi:hypothetical protein